MTRKTNLVVLLVAAAATVLAVAGFSTAASSSAPVNTAEPKISGTAQEGETLAASSGPGRAPDDHLQVPVAPLQRSGHRLFEHRRSRLLELSAEVRRRRPYCARSRHREERRRLGGDGIGRERRRHGEDHSAAHDDERLPDLGVGTLDVSAIAPPARLQIDGQAVSPTVITRSTNDVMVRFHVSACSCRSISTRWSTRRPCRIRSSRSHPRRSPAPTAG